MSERTNIFVISDTIKNRIEEFDSGQIIVFYNMKPWQIGKGFTIDYLILCGYIWADLDWEIKLCIAPMINSRPAPDMGARIIEI